MELIIYKNGRKYSNIKFSTVYECLEFIKFNGIKANDVYNIFEYSTGEFYTQYYVDNSDNIWKNNNPEKKPRKRKF